MTAFFIALALFTFIVGFIAGVNVAFGIMDMDEEVW